MIKFWPIVLILLSIALLALAASRRARTRTSQPAALAEGEGGAFSDFDRLIVGTAPPQQAPSVPLTASCHWVLDRLRKDRASRRWVCDTCGAVDYTMTGRAPKECQRRSVRITEH